MNRGLALELLGGGKAGIENWNLFRHSESECPSLEGADFTEAQLAGANLSGLELTGAIFRQANLRGADLSGADLEKAEFSEAKLTRANLQNANLQGANFDSAKLAGADFGESFLADANLSSAEGKKIRLRSARLYDANLSFAKFTEADLREADFSGANLNGATLDGADLRQAKLEKARMDGVDLEKANLRGADLSGADLTDACLAEADLRRSSLRNARLKRADLTDADLRQSDLTGVDFTEADLTRANLVATVLKKANFTATVLTETDFKNSHCALTNFNRVDLSSTYWLERIRHLSPSSLSLDTLSMSQWKIPEPFLRGCAVPASLIGQIPALRDSLRPVERPTCLIGYSPDDVAFARQLHTRMYADGFRVWYDVIEHESARVFTERIEEALRMHSRLLIVVSEASREAEWLRTEFGRAFLKGKNGTIAIAHAISLLSPDDLLEWKCYVASCSRDLAEVQRRSGIPDFSRWEDPDSFERAYGQLAEALSKS